MAPNPPRGRVHRLRARRPARADPVMLEILDAQGALVRALQQRGRGARRRTSRRSASRRNGSTPPSTLSAGPRACTASSGRCAIRRPRALADGNAVRGRRLGAARPLHRRAQRSDGSPPDPAARRSLPDPRVTLPAGGLRPAVRAGPPDRRRRHARVAAAVTDADAAAKRRRRRRRPADHRSARPGPARARSSEAAARWLRRRRAHAVCARWPAS